MRNLASEPSSEDSQASFGCLASILTSVSLLTCETRVGKFVLPSGVEPLSQGSEPHGLSVSLWERCLGIVAKVFVIRLWYIYMAKVLLHEFSSNHFRLSQ